MVYVCIEFFSWSGCWKFKPQKSLLENLLHIIVILSSGTEAVEVKYFLDFLILLEAA